MPDYDRMYKSLFNAMTLAITILQEAQKSAEEIYISSDPATIKILRDSNDRNNDKSEENNPPVYIVKDR